MTTTQGYIQPEQLTGLCAQVAQDSNDQNNVEDFSIVNKQSNTVKTLSSESPVEDSRRAFKGLSERSVNQEVANQEQEQPSEAAGETTEKVNDYVSRVLERIMKQKSKMAQLSSILEKRGLKASQVNELIQSFDEATAETCSKEDDSEEYDTRSKENFSPERNKNNARLEAQVPNQEKSPEVAAKPQKAALKYKLEDVLQISRKSISFGARFPGQIVEEDFEIINKSGHDFIVQIHIDCLNEELENTDEYVFSVRRNHLYDYNDKHYLIMAPYSCAAFKFALKVPNMKVVGNVKGQVRVGIQNLNGNFTVDLSASVAIPKVYCPKELQFKGMDHKVIKLAIKEGKKQDFKLPIRNDGDVPVTLELEFFEPNNDQDSKTRTLFDCFIHPSVVTVAPNSTAFTNISVRPWKGMSLMKGTGKQHSARKILAARVKDSALVYSFVFWIEFY